MNTGMISTRYARAFYNFAKLQKNENDVYEYIGQLIDILNNSENHRKILQHPLLTANQKKNYFDRVLQTEKIPVVKKFTDVVFENKREDLLLYIFLKYRDIYREDKHILAGKIITATTYNAQIESKFIEVIESATNGKLEIEKKLDSSIIGGFILEVDHYRWDASVSGQLKSLKKRFTEQNRKTI